MRAVCLMLLIFVLPDRLYAESLRTRIVLASYRLEESKTSGTCFLLHRPDPSDETQQQLLLITAAHTFEKMSSDRATLVLRKQDEAEKWQAAPIEIRIRTGDQPLWHQHPKEDVAVLPVRLPEGITANSLPN